VFRGFEIWKTSENSLWDTYVKTGLAIDLNWRKATGTGINSNDNLANRGTWVDLTSNGNNASLQNFAYAAGSGWSDGLDFDGTDDRGLIAYKSSIDLTNTLTLEMWVQVPTDFADGDYILSRLNGTAGVTYAFRPGKATAGFMTRVGATWYTANNAKNLKDNNLHQILCIYDKNLSSNNMQLFIDNVLDSQTTLTTGLPSTTSEVNIGANYVSSANAKFKLKSLRLYNFAFTPEQRQQNFNAGV
jgi:hypothetical protein